MSLITKDIDQIKDVLGNRYIGRDKGAFIALTDEKYHHIVYSGDNYALLNLLAYIVATFAKDEIEADLNTFLSQFNDAVRDAYRHEGRKQVAVGIDSKTETEVADTEATSKEVADKEVAQ